jgi:hypothetical protein
MIIVQPVNHPNRPLEDRAGDRPAGRELREVQRDEQLAAEDERPRPEERSTAQPEAESEQLEDRGEDRDEGEARREGGERADPAVEFLLVAEAGEPLGVDVGRGARCMERCLRRTHDCRPFAEYLSGDR